MAESVFDHFQFALIHGPNIPGSYAILFFTISDFTFTIRDIHNWALFLLWRSLFIPPEKPVSADGQTACRDQPMPHFHDPVLSSFGISVVEAGMVRSANMIVSGINYNTGSCFFQCRPVSLNTNQPGAVAARKFRILFFLTFSKKRTPGALYSPPRCTILIFLLY